LLDLRLAATGGRITRVRVAEPLPELPLGRVESGLPLGHLDRGFVEPAPLLFQLLGPGLELLVTPPQPALQVFRPELGFHERQLAPVYFCLRGGQRQLTSVQLRS